MKVYKCDTCGATLESFDSGKWISIGSMNGHDLKIKNNLDGGRLIEADKHSDIHFCSKKCLNNYLFL